MYNQQATNKLQEHYLTWRAAVEDSMAAPRAAVKYSNCFPSSPKVSLLKLTRCVYVVQIRQVLRDFNPQMGLMHHDFEQCRALLSNTPITFRPPPRS